MGDGAASEFQRAVERATQDTPYTVVGTDKGFDVELRLADAQWRQLFGTAGLRRTYRWSVKEKNSRYSITDESSSVRWAAGVPRLDFSGSKQSGRILSLSRDMIWAPTVDGGVVPVADYRFDSSEGRDLIRLVGSQLGLKEREPAVIRGAYVAMAAPFLVGLAFFIADWLQHR